jgi:hypothetical protein
MNCGKPGERVKSRPDPTPSPETKAIFQSSILNGIVNLNGLPTTYYFEWGLTTAYGNTSPVQSAGSGWDNIAVTANLKGRNYQRSIYSMMLIILFNIIALFFGYFNMAIGDINVTVTNSSDIVNGNTSSISALISNPGSDGISFREALEAANNTSGPKLILFNSSLKGATITFASNGNLLLITGGDLTINGDLDQDGISDITLDGSLGQANTPTGPGLIVTSSNIIISNLMFINFKGSAIIITILSQPCGSFSNKYLNNIKIIGNTITTLDPDHPALSIGSGGLCDSSFFPQYSDITFRDLIITNNTITTQSWMPIYVSAGVGGGSRNKIINLTISNNNIFTGTSESAIDINAADCNSSYFGIPGPVQYSNDNIIENLSILGNSISAPNGFGIGISTANYGNQNNQIKNILVERNNISVKMRGIYVNNGAINNLISNVMISENIFTNNWVGIEIEFGPDVASCPIANHNRIEDVVLKKNIIDNFDLAGICISGGNYSNDNILDRLTIAGNQINKNNNQNYGIWIRGGASQNLTTLRNQVRDVHIVNNQFVGAGLSLRGGIGNNVQNNSITIQEIHDNTYTNVPIPLSIIENEVGATNNTILLSVFDQEKKPIVITNLVKNLTPKTVTLNGSINPNGYYTTYYFEWGINTSYGNKIPTQPGLAGIGTTNVNVSNNLTSLTPNSTYHFRLVATNKAGTVYGADMIFKTGIGLTFLPLLLD